MADPFGRALLDHTRGARTEPLLQVDGETELEHPIEAFYFGDRSPDSERTAYLEDRLTGPLLDMGAGVGRDVLYFQERMEAIGLEVSENLVTAMRERGVERAVAGDMFDLRASFDRDRFASAYAWGTQVGLAGSLAGLRAFLSDLAHVTTPDAVAVLDAYDPTHDAVREFLGFRPDPTPGLASRVMHFEYEGERGETLLFRLFSPNRFREACVGTPWAVTDVRHDSDGSPYHYGVTLRK